MSFVTSSRVLTPHFQDRLLSNPGLASLAVAAALGKLGQRSLAMVVAAAWVVLGPLRAAGAPADITPPRRLDVAPVPYPLDGKGDAAVDLVIVVDPTGVVTDVRVRQGAPPFAHAAVAAVHTWRFAPATRDETSIASRIAVTVTFHAPPPAPEPPPAGRHVETQPRRAPVPPAGPAPEPPIDVSVKGQREELGTNHI